MNLVCFPHYTAGGLFCEILNNVTSKVSSNGGFLNEYHQYGVIQPDKPVLDDYDPQVLYSQIDQLDIPADAWIGTHCWPGLLDVTRFDKIINITTCTFRSRFFRWARMFNLYFSTRMPTDLDDMDRIDKMRWLAKEYVKPYPVFLADNITNIEFASIVDFDVTAKKILGFNSRYGVWKDTNSFLYDRNLWTSDLALRYYEAEYEIFTGREYEYK